MSPPLFFTYNLKLYAVLTAFLSLEVSSYTITLKTPTVQSQTVVLLHALVPSMKVKQTNEQLFITRWHLEASVSLKRSSVSFLP